MDELDRMYRRLVQNVRAGSPDLLARPFEVSQIYQQLIPYRLNRRELGLESNEEYELTLMQLLSGARGLLGGDDEMQQALRSELESPNPDLSAFRAFATSTVTLVPEALRALDSQPLVRNPAPSPQAAPPADKPPASVQAAMAGRATEEVDVATPSPTAAPKATRSRSARSAPQAPAPLGSRHTPVGCRYCGGELPEGRDVAFCPHCGQNLTVKQCPACSTELELGWRYCVTCGRQVE